MRGSLAFSPPHSSLVSSFSPFFGNLEQSTVERNREIAFKQLAPWVLSRTCRVAGKLRYVQDCKAISCYTDCSLELNRN